MRLHGFATVDASWEVAMLIRAPLRLERAKKLVTNADADSNVPKSS